MFRYDEKKLQESVMDLLAISKVATGWEPARIDIKKCKDYVSLSVENDDNNRTGISWLLNGGEPADVG